MGGSQSTHNQNERIPMGQHSLVKQLSKAIYNTRPPKSLYLKTWEVSKIVNALRELGDNGDLSLKVPSMKLVLLMSLVAASCSSELQPLDLKGARYVKGIQAK